MPARKILVIDDERSVRDMIVFVLARDGYDVCEASDAEAGAASLAHTPFDLLLLDWILPGTQGIELLMTLRADPASKSLPIIMLTARASERDKVEALDGGADDYIAKPFAVRELLARINAVLRRRSPVASPTVITADRLLLDKEREQVSIDGVPVKLRRSEFVLLSFLLTNPDRAYSREELVAALGDVSDLSGPRMVDVRVSRLREALEPYSCDQFIQTVRSAGYRFSTLI
jgi:two-component system, OmpR family, phosphate regulon response regulator PhoB